MIELLLTIVLIYFAIKAVGFLWRVFSGVNQFNKVRQQMNDAFRAQQQAQQQQQSPKKKKKKIDPSVGEYVSFEEVPDTAPEANEASQPRQSTPSEPQVEDAVWEDIK